MVNRDPRKFRLESKNPSLRAKTFDFTRDQLATGTMTMSGAIHKSGLLLLILGVGAVIGWNNQSSPLMILGAVLGLISALIVIFKPPTAPFVSPAYAFFEGLFLGSISVVMDQRFPGIAANAMTLTFAVLALMLICYRTGLLRATPVFRRVVIFATLAIAATYLVNLVMGLFGSGMPMIHESSPVGIGFSVVVTGVAALNLIMDFDLFERNAEQSPKYMEWYCGFALMMTLVWLYLEMLRLLGKIQKR